MDKVICRVFRAANPIDGSPIYEDIYQSDIEEFYEIKWEDLSHEDKVLIVNEFML